MATIEEDEGNAYVPIGCRPEWADVQPRAPPEAAQHVVCIARDQQFGDLMDFFWAAVEAKELSERVLALTEEIIVELNSANYTVWEWRWRCVQALGGMAVHSEAEDALTRRVAHDNPKNYQLWNYRRRCALALGPQHAEQELEFAAEALAFDAKNYHAWAHRQALVEAFGGGTGAGGAGSGSAARPMGGGLWERELAFTERLLRDDVRNNSAWNQRLFVLARALPGALAGEAGEVYDREVEFACTKLRLAPHNESAWSYLRGLARLPGAPQHAAGSDARWRAAASDALAAHPSCVPALALLGDIYAEQAALLDAAAAGAVVATGGGAGGGAEAPPAFGKLAAAAAVARRLACELLRKLTVADPIRAGYYQHKARQLELWEGQQSA